MKFKFNGQGLGLFLSGAIVSLLASKVLKSDCARKCIVNTVAKGMQLKDETESKIALIKEDAEDVYAEAKLKNLNSVDAQENGEG